MTQREKAKAYDNIVNKLRRFMAQGVEHLITRADVQDFFPEIFESEDERIEKEIIAFLKENLETGRAEETWSLSGLKRWIAWLEKQGQEKHLSEPIKDYQGSFTCWNNAHDFRPKHLQRCICYDKYMGGVYCYVYDDISKYWCTQTTEEHDSDGDNHISDYADYRITLWMPLPDTSFYPSKSLLEKQGKPKWTDEDEERLQSCIIALQGKGLMGGVDTMDSKWLKSLKQRMGEHEKQDVQNLASSAKTCENDTLLDLLHKMPSYITVDDVDYHFVLKKTIAYMAFYEGEGEGSGKVIFWMAGEPVPLLTAMLNKLKEEGLLE